MSRCRATGEPAYEIRSTKYDRPVLTSSAVIAVLVRPWLWPTAVGAMVAMAPRGWWKRPPFLPIPDGEVVRWRVTTAYGQPDMALESDDVLSYLRWRRQA